MMYATLSTSGQLQWISGVSKSKEKLLARLHSTKQTHVVAELGECEFPVWLLEVHGQPKSFTRVTAEEVRALREAADNESLGEADHTLFYVEDEWIVENPDCDNMGNLPHAHLDGMGYDLFVKLT
jgi:hypothetical protein